MKTTTNLATRRRAAIVLALGILAAIACGKTASDGGDTHWLGACSTDSDCRSGSCLCGICTETCSGDPSCRTSGRSAACFDVDSPGLKARCPGPVPTAGKGICLAACDARVACAGGTECLQGACVRSESPLDGGASAGGGASGTTAAGGADGGGSGTTGAGGHAGTGGTTLDGGPTCRVPSTELPTGTAAEQQRASLIHAFCVNLSQHGCLPISGGTSFISASLTVACAADTLIRACELDVAYEYAQWVSSACDGAWRTAIQCAAATPYTHDQCNSANLLTSSPGAVLPCNSEKQAYQVCIQGGPGGTVVVGSRASCAWGFGTTTPCDVGCDVGTNHFELVCGGPEGLPLRCECSVNGHALGDNDFAPPPHVVYASNCADAAQLAANGECVNRLDCCVKYKNAGTDQCICGANPSALGYATCDALAQSVSGQVVAICPQYEPAPPPPCFPPPCGG